MNVTMLPVVGSDGLFQWTDANFTITKSAMKMLKEACTAEEKTAIRIGVKGGGCSGFTYNLEAIDLATVDQEEDMTTGVDGFFLVMDVFSRDYLKGTTLDYLSTLKESGFKFENPLSKRTCGCSASFSV